MINKCGLCPFRDDPKFCICQLLDWERGCYLLSQKSDYRPFIEQESNSPPDKLVRLHQLRNTDMEGVERREELAVISDVVRCGYRTVRGCNCKGYAMCSLPSKKGKKTVNDCKECKRDSVPTYSGSEKKKISLEIKQCPGDMLVATAALESLHAMYPDEYATEIRVATSGVFDHNPHVVKLEGDNIKRVEWKYDLVHKSNQLPISFMQAYTHGLSKVIERPIPLLVNRPHLYLTTIEKTSRSQVSQKIGRHKSYWVVNAGSKSCFPTKQWNVKNYQRVIDLLKDKVIFTQVGSRESGHHHPMLEGVIDLVGQTSLRQLIRVCYHSVGGIGPSTFIQHIFAALQKPYILIDSAREPTHWIAYNTQQSLVKHGCLPCCAHEACWKTKIDPNKTNEKESLCHYPILTEDPPTTRCLEMIDPVEVVRAISHYYNSGLLSMKSLMVPQNEDQLNEVIGLVQEQND